MSKAPDWMSKADSNTIGNEVGKTAVIDNKQLRSKPGPKKSLVQRKHVGIKISNDKNKEIDHLRLLLQTNGISLTRDRSETVELAVQLAIAILTNKDKAQISWAVGFLNSVVGLEDQNALTELS